MYISWSLEVIVKLFSLACGNYNMVLLIQNIFHHLTSFDYVLEVLNPSQYMHGMYIYNSRLNSKNPLTFGLWFRVLILNKWCFTSFQVFSQLLVPNDEFWGYEFEVCIIYSNLEILDSASPLKQQNLRSSDLFVFCTSAWVTKRWLKRKMHAPRSLHVLQNTRVTKVALERRP